MPEIEICLTCGEQLIPVFIIQDEMVMLCPNCDNDEEYEDQCSCHQDEINIFCSWCF